MNEDKNKSPITKDNLDLKIIHKKNQKRKIIRCTCCKQKCNLIRFDCKCGGVFCSVHRYAHMHKCNYIETKTMKQKEDIEKNNPKIENEKFEKI